MTSLPIMWFAMFDYAFAKNDRLVEFVRLPFPELDNENEAEERKKQDLEYFKFQEEATLNPDKDSFLQNPNKYKIGINGEGECYSLKIFLAVFLRGAITDAAVIYFTVFKPIAYNVQPDGHEYGFFAAGMSVFCASVFLANIWLLMRFH